MCGWWSASFSSFASRRWWRRWRWALLGVCSLIIDYGDGVATEISPFTVSHPSDLIEPHRTFPLPHYIIRYPVTFGFQMQQNRVPPSRVSTGTSLSPAPCKAAAWGHPRHWDRANFLPGTRVTLLKQFIKVRSQLGMYELRRTLERTIFGFRNEEEDKDEADQSCWETRSSHTRKSVPRPLWCEPLVPNSDPASLWKRGQYNWPTTSQVAKRTPNPDRGSWQL